MNRRDFLKAGVAASAVVALPINAEAVKPLQAKNRMERYQAYQAIMNDNFELNDKIQKIAGEAAKRVGDVGVWDINVGVQGWDKFGDESFIGSRSQRRFKSLYHAYNLAVYGDGFYELVYNTDYPSDTLWRASVLSDWPSMADYPSDTLWRRPILTQELPADTMYRIETMHPDERPIKGEVVEYQQSKTGVDYAALSKPLDTVGFNSGSTAIRFRPDQIYHLRIGPPIFQPYGTSLLEVVRKNPDAKIGEGAIENFMVVFEKGVQDLKDLCK